MAWSSGKNPGNYFQFLLDGCGAVRIARHFAGLWSQLAHREGLRHLHSSGLRNQFVIVKRDSTIHIFITDLHTVSIQDYIRTGRHGLVVARGTRVEFSDLQIDGVKF